MTQRLTRVTASVVAAAPPTIVAREVLDNPPVIIPPNWIESVKVSTTWQSDVVSAADLLTNDSRILISRPVRSQTLLFTTLNVQNSAALIAMLHRYATQQAPLPLYSDFSVITQDVIAFSVIVYCNTLHRRFFRGQRIALFAWNLDDVTDSVGEYAIIAEIYGDRIHVVTPLTNDFPPGARVYPLMDVEELTESTVDLLTNTIDNASVTFLERAGESALPALWPAGGATAGFAPSYLGRPVMLARPNWAQAPQLSISRDIARAASGKASILDVPSAGPRIGVAGVYDRVGRAEAWDVLRFYDSRGGRGHTWWSVALQDSWQLLEMTATEAVVRGGGRLADIVDMVTHVGLLSRGEWLGARGVASIVAGVDPQEWTITFDAPYDPVPDAPNLRPLYLVRFSSDTITEEWAGTEFCSISLRAEEVVEEEDVGVADLPDPIVSELAPATIPDLHWWFDGTRNLYILDQRLGAGVTVRTTPWPSDHHLASEWMDVRESLPNVVRQADLPRHRFTNYHTSQAALIPYQLAVRNHGYPAQVLRTNWRLKSLGGLLPVADQEAWDNELGCTIVLVFIGGKVPPFPDNVPVLQWKESVGGNLVFRWGLSVTGSNAELQLYQVPGTIDANLKITHPSVFTARPQLIAFRWTPGGNGQVIMAAAGASSPTIYQTASTLSTFPTVIGYQSTSDWFASFANDIAPASGLADDLYRENPLLIAFLAFKRALSNGEINDLMAYYRDSHGIDYTPIP